MERTRTIVRTSVQGIGVNLVLVAFKAAVGWLSGSIAVILDAVNNLSDALSSVITIIGTKLANKAPDKKHPYGHGRIEYITAVLIAGIVLAAGISSLRESVMKILHPEEADYAVWSLVIIAVAVAVKFFWGRYVKAVGNRVNADVLVASGSDALFDAILSFTTLVGAAISLLWHVSLEGMIGAAISLFIVKAGVDMLRDTLSTIIGKRTDPAVSEALKKTICSFPDVYGAYDLTLHNYGPSRVMGSVHIEVPDQMTAVQIHRLSRQIATKVFAEYGVLLSIGVYAHNDSDPAMAAIKQWVQQKIEADPAVVQMHGFYADPQTKQVMFDLIVDFSADAEQVRSNLLAALGERYPDMQFDVILDTDFSD